MQDGSAYCRFPQSPKEAFQKLGEELGNLKLKKADDSSSQTTNNKLLCFIKEELNLIKQEDERERERFAEHIEV